MPRKKNRFVLCVAQGTYRASLQMRKVYRVVDDSKAEAHALLRVIDESGEGYLFPTGLFVPIEVPTEAAPVFRGIDAPLERPGSRSSAPAQQRDAHDEGRSHGSAAPRR
jgi:hypothetical protein